MIDGYYSAAGSHPNSSHHGAGPSTTNATAGDGVGNQAPYSPQSFLQPSINDVSAPSTTSSPNNYGRFPSGVPPSEMSGESPATPELSPNPDAPQINKSGPGSPNSHNGGMGQGGQRTALTSDEAMRPNLEISHDSWNGGRNHVMSWMSYEGVPAGPTTTSSK